MVWLHNDIIIHVHFTYKFMLLLTQQAAVIWLHNDIIIYVYFTYKFMFLLTQQAVVIWHFLIEMHQQSNRPQ